MKLFSDERLVIEHRLHTGTSYLEKTVLLKFLEDTAFDFHKLVGY